MSTINGDIRIPIKKNRKARYMSPGILITGSHVLL